MEVQGDLRAILMEGQGRFRATLWKVVGFSSHFKEGWEDSRVSVVKNGGRGGGVLHRTIGDVYLHC